MTPKAGNIDSLKSTGTNSTDGSKKGNAPSRSNDLRSSGTNEGFQNGAKTGNYCKTDMSVDGLKSKSTN